MNRLRYLTLAILATTAALLSACGGGGDEAPLDPHVCYVEGKAMPSKACQ